MEYLKPEEGLFNSVNDAIASLTAEENPEHKTEQGSIKLKAIFEYLEERISYEDIKLSKIFISFPS